MAVWLLASMLVGDTQVTIKDQDTGRLVWQGTAEDAVFNDEVKDWDFSNGHVIFI